MKSRHQNWRATLGVTQKHTQRSQLQEKKKTLKAEFLLYLSFPPFDNERTTQVKEHLSWSEHTSRRYRLICYFERTLCFTGASKKEHCGPFDMA